MCIRTSRLCLCEDDLRIVVQFLRSRHAMAWSSLAQAPPCDGFSNFCATLRHKHNIQMLKDIEQNTNSYSYTMTIQGGPV